MRLVLRRGVAVAVPAAAFGLSWWACQEQLRLDEGAALGIAGAMLAVFLAVAAWRAPQERSGGGGPGSGGWRVAQQAHAGQDVNMAGRDQAIVNYRHRDE